MLGGLGACWNDSWSVQQWCRVARLVAKALLRANFVSGSRNCSVVSMRTSISASVPAALYSLPGLQCQYTASRMSRNGDGLNSCHSMDK